MFNRPINRWWTVLGGALGASVGSGVVGVYVFGIFAKAIGAEYGWPRSSVSLGLVVLAAATGIGNLTLGLAIDRFGMRRVAAIYVFLFGAAIATVPLLPAHLAPFIATFAIAGFFGSAAAVLPYSVAICAWFDKERGLALGLCNMGTGLGAVIMPFYAQYLLARFGWRGGYWGVATVVAAIALVSLALLVRFPQDYEAKKREKTKNDPEAKIRLWDIVRTERNFWLITFAIFVISISTYGVISQLVSIGTDRGFNSLVAASILSIAGMSSLSTRIVVGYVMDRIFAPYVAATVFLITIAGMALLATGQTLNVVILGAVMIGVGAGSEGDILTFLVSRYFAPSAFGSVVGAVWVTWAWGGAVGTYLLSLCFDKTHSYTFAIYGFIVALFVGAVALIRLGKYRVPVGRAAIGSDGTSQVAAEVLSS